MTADAMLAEQVCDGLSEPARKYVWDNKAKTADWCALRNRSR